MVSWEVMLSKGQEWDWLDDPFWRMQTLITFFLSTIDTQLDVAVLSS